MIPEYRLISHLLLLKSNYFFKRQIKKKLGHLQIKEYRSAYKLVFNCNKNLMFIKIISVYLEFNTISYKKYLQLVANFILTISALLPILKRQEKNLYNYQKSQKILLSLGCKDEIEQWINNSFSNVVLPDFLVSNSKLTKEKLSQIKKLVHISGEMFVTLNTNPLNNRINYEFGTSLMLFYILDLETRQTLITKDVTNFNLKSIFSYKVLFTNKIKILDELINNAMILEKFNFNLYIRIMNYALLGNYE